MKYCAKVMFTNVMCLQLLQPNANQDQKPSEFMKHSITHTWDK